MSKRIEAPGPGRATELDQLLGAALKRLSDFESRLAQTERALDELLIFARQLGAPLTTEREHFEKAQARLDAWLNLQSDTLRAERQASDEARQALRLELEASRTSHNSLLKLLDTASACSPPSGV